MDFKGLMSPEKRLSDFYYSYRYLELKDKRQLISAVFLQ